VIGEKLSGIALHIGARIGTLAAPDEVLISRTIGDLMAVAIVVALLWPRREPFSQGSIAEVESGP
jgi:hypothetical protein